MELRNPELPPPPPGAVAALVNGFNAVAAHISVILFPLAFDIFLWLGPRLKADALLAPVMEIINQMPAGDANKNIASMMNEFSSGFNMFSLMRTLPMGISSLMDVNTSLQTPTGNRLAFTPQSWSLSFMLVIALTIFGWVAGSIYFWSVAQVTTKEKTPGIWPAIFQGVLLSGLWTAFFFIINIPALIFILVLFMFNDTIRLVIFFLAGIPLLWFLMAVFYSAHGIFTEAQNTFTSLWKSFRLVRYSLPALGWFSFLAIIINQGMNLLWRAAPATSWMTLVGILGHAFISTSLLAASFIYYREMNTWLELTLAWLKTNKTSSARA